MSKHHWQLATAAATRKWQGCSCIFGGMLCAILDTCKMQRSLRQDTVVLLCQHRPKPWHSVGITTQQCSAALHMHAACVWWWMVVVAPSAAPSSMQGRLQAHLNLSLQATAALRQCVLATSIPTVRWEVIDFVALASTQQRDATHVCVSWSQCCSIPVDHRADQGICCSCNSSPDCPSSHCRLNSCGPFTSLAKVDQHINLWGTTGGGREACSVELM